LCRLLHDICGFLILALLALLVGGRFCLNFFCYTFFCSTLLTEGTFCMLAACLLAFRPLHRKKSPHVCMFATPCKFT